MTETKTKRLRAQSTHPPPVAGAGTLQEAIPPSASSSFCLNSGFLL